MWKSVIVIFSCCVVGGYGYSALSCGKNEAARCIQECPPEKTCRNRGIQFSCLQVATPCVNKCVCKDGYIRKSENSECIPSNECPLSCGKNEEARCIQDCPPQKTCGNREKQFDCPQVAPCVNKCVCQEGYIRKSENGECIPSNGCTRAIRSTPKFCNQNEEVQCVRESCPAELSCKDNGSLNCPDVLEPCKDRCVCKRGFFRSSGGNCITREQCDKCKGAHEYFDCGSACDNECHTIHKQNKTNCPILNIVCNQKCYCEDDFARDKHNNCIPIDKCFV